MIVVYLNSSGYYVTGPDTEIIQRCNRKLGNNGVYVFQEHHHLYMVLFRALQALNKQSLEDIILYNDTRIIDELNGNLVPLDEWSIKWHDLIMQYIVPSIRGVILFRKKNSSEIDRIVQSKQNMLLKEINIAKIEKPNKSMKQKALARLRNWMLRY